jgi:hypothetical protein
LAASIVSSHWPKRNVILQEQENFEDQSLVARRVRLLLFNLSALGGRRMLNIILQTTNKKTKKTKNKKKQKKQNLRQGMQESKVKTTFQSHASASGLPSRTGATFSFSLIAFIPNAIHRWISTRSWGVGGVCFSVNIWRQVSKSLDCLLG